MGFDCKQKLCKTCLFGQFFIMQFGAEVTGGLPAALACLFGAKFRHRVASNYPNLVMMAALYVVILQNH
jgi:hypothetical protein